MVPEHLHRNKKLRRFPSHFVHFSRFGKPESQGIDPI